MSEFDPRTITRPHADLMKHYFIIALCTVFGFPFAIWPLWFKYMTLRYRFDDEGVAMAWGVLFKKEIYLTYRRIQDIHVTRGIIQRWLGLASVAVQTASGSGGAEMTIEGVKEYDALRDFLYRKMRGAKGVHEEAPGAPGAAAGGGAPTGDEVLVVLRGSGMR